MISCKSYGLNYYGRQSALKKQAKHDISYRGKKLKTKTDAKMESPFKNFIQNQPLLKTIYKTPPIISYKKGKSLKDMLVRAKL